MTPEDELDQLKSKVAEALVLAHYRDGYVYINDDLAASLWLLVADKIDEIEKRMLGE